MSEERHPDHKTIFPTDVPPRDFVEFATRGYECPVTGVIFDGSDPLGDDE